MSNVNEFSTDRSADAGRDSLRYLSCCVEGVMGVAVARGDWDRAAHLCGLRDAIMATTGSHLPPIRPSWFDDATRQIRANATTDLPASTGDPIRDLADVVTENGSATAGASSRSPP